MKHIFLKPSLRNVSFTLLALICLFYLGFWQLERAEEKSKILDEIAKYSRQDPTLWTSEMAKPSAYQWIRVEGQSLATILLLDNQYYQHRPGLHVISPLELVDGKVLLVDRGWVPGVENFKPLQNQLLGQVYFPSAKTMVLGNIIEKKTEQGLVIEKLDIQLISHFLQKTVYPFIIRLGPLEANGFARDWQANILPISPERHRAYALQWFLMALVLLIIFIGYHKK